MPYKDPARKRDYDRQWRRMNADIYGRTRKPILPYIKLIGGPASQGPRGEIAQVSSPAGEEDFAA